MDYFTRLGLAIEYDLNQDLLEKKYLEQQKKFHPDQQLNNKLEAIQATIEINAAYKTLKSNHKRAEYILSLRGINLENIQANHNILVEAMDDRQSLENSQDLNDLLQQVNDQIDAGLVKFKQFLDQEDIANAAQEVIRLRYKKKFSEEIEFKLNS
jgi:molecular chaperone HscB